MKKKCGIFGIYSKDNNIDYMKKGLELLQHRGQESFGICFVDNNKIITKKYIGLVKDSYRDIVEKSNISIGHVRYSTSGNSKKDKSCVLEETQPLSGIKNNIHFSIAHNGNIPKFINHDTKELVKFIENHSSNNFEEILIDLIEKINAAFCLLIITRNAIYGLRDRYGIRPLCIGSYNDDYCISSESCAIQHFNLIRDINAGEIIKLTRTGYKSIYLSNNKEDSSLCSFEYIYFMKPLSVHNGKSIKNYRKELGLVLAEKETIVEKDYIVCGVPSSGLIYAESYSDKLNLNMYNIIEKNKLSNRSFIESSQMKREDKCKHKFIFDKDKIRDKKIIIVDDSIVRGTVIKYIISKFKEYGAKEIHIRIPSPPVIDKCDFGIDIPTNTELLAYNRSIDEIKNILNINSICYLTIEELNRVLPKNAYKQYFGVNVDSKLYI